MSNHLDRLKSTTQTHPTETIFVVAAITAFAVVFHYKRKEKKTAIRAEEERRRAMRSHWMRKLYTRRPKRYVLDFAA